MLIFVKNKNFQNFIKCNKAFIMIFKRDNYHKKEFLLDLSNFSETLRYFP